MPKKAQSRFIVISLGISAILAIFASMLVNKAKQRQIEYEQARQMQQREAEIQQLGLDIRDAYQTRLKRSQSLAARIAEPHKEYIMRLGFKEVDAEFELKGKNVKVFPVITPALILVEAVRAHKQELNPNADLSRYEAEALILNRLVNYLVIIYELMPADKATWTDSELQEVKKKFEKYKKYLDEILDAASSPPSTKPFDPTLIQVRVFLYFKCFFAGKICFFTESFFNS
ncbi:hypothetical protein KW782_01245 [Candidatus Parcubacteria bacterium]|nr:hypothetical protein [Candidatus Parcubacteria bacterium]